MAAHWTARVSPYDVVTAVFIAGLVIIAFHTFRDYAISNDEGVQHHYGELIISYYASGFATRAYFIFRTFIFMAACSTSLPSRSSSACNISLRSAPRSLHTDRGQRHRRHGCNRAMIAGPRAAVIAAVALACCGAWYGAMFNHTKDIPFAAGMIGATLFLIRIARSLPSPAPAMLLLWPVSRGRARHAGARFAPPDLYRFCARPLHAWPWLRSRPPPRWRCCRFAAALVYPRSCPPISS